MARFETLGGRPSGDGLDASEDPPWLLLSADAPKQIRLRDAAHWSVSAPGHGLVSVVVDGAPGAPDRGITVTAFGEGTSTIEARSPDGRRTIHLTVYTRPMLSMTIAFYFACDEAGHRTTRPMAEAAGILQRLKDIYSPQANITFHQVDFQPVTVPGDLGPHIDLPSPGHGAGAEFAAIEAATVAQRVMGVRALSQALHARLRVHFVWSIHQVGVGGDDVEGASLIGGDTLVIEDNLSAEVGAVVAHEVGHALGLTHHGAHHHWLMYPTTQGFGTTIPKRHVDLLNPAP